MNDQTTTDPATNGKPARTPRAARTPQRRSPQQPAQSPAPNGPRLTTLTLDQQQVQELGTLLDFCCRQLGGVQGRPAYKLLELLENSEAASVAAAKQEAAQQPAE